MSRLPFTLTSLMTPQAKEPAKREIITVHQLVESVKRNIESNYRLVHVIGEVSSFKPWRSGHWYFDIKDEQALLPCVMFRNLTTRVPFEVKDGLQIIVTGKASVYAQQSKIQLIVERIEPCGVGALALAFEQLKEKLSAEGLFSEDRKKLIPLFPKVIGIVSSPQGAALQDMLRVLGQRMPSARVLLSSCRVQGQGSANEIAEALKRLDACGECDVIIVGRGGGSLEDLWSFNDESLARVIAGCKTPIVSAVGHETDFSISDFVADLRAATPTHAASLVVQDYKEVQKLLSHQEARLDAAIKSMVRNRTMQLERLARRLQDPRMLLIRHAQRVEELLTRLKSVAQKKQALHFDHILKLKKRLSLVSPMARVNLISRRLKSLSQRFWLLLPRTRVDKAVQRVTHLEGRLQDLASQRIKGEREKLNRIAASLHALSPLAVMGRGYAIVYKEESNRSHVVTSSSQVLENDLIRVRLADGSITAQILNKTIEGSTDG